MEIDDLAGVGVADPHVVDVVDLAAGGVLGQSGGDDLHPFRGGIDAERQFRLQRLDVDVDLDVLAELLLDVALQRVGDVMGVLELHVGVDPGNGSVLRNLSILPKGFTSGDRFEKIRKAFGEPDYEVKESDNGMLIYKKLDDGLELSLNFEPNSEKGPLGLSNYDLWLPLK